MALNILTRANVIVLCFCLILSLGVSFLIVNLIFIPDIVYFLQNEFKLSLNLNLK